MNLKFWKKKTAQESEVAAAPDQPGLLARLAARFKRPTPFKAEATENENADTPTPNRAKRIGLIAGGIALLLALLIALGYAAKSIMQNSPDPAANPQQLLDESRTPAQPLMPASEAASATAMTEVSNETVAVSSPEPADRHEEKPAIAEKNAPKAASGEKTTKESPPAPPAHIAPQSQKDAPQLAEPDTKNAEIEELKKRNAELQKQLSTLKNEQRQSSRVRMYPGRSGPVAGGSVTVESTDPKSAAATLKDAIDAMNSGDSRGKPTTGAPQPGKDKTHEQQ